MSTKQIKLPKMPYGEGSMSLRPDGTIMYRKRIGEPKREKTVYGSTPKECIQKMKDEEALLRKKVVDQDKVSLVDAMLSWLDTVKKPTLKSQSYTRLKSTIQNQIEQSDIGYIRYKNITTDDIQELINHLNEENYSHSTIKKTYDALNAFYRYASAKEKIDNPMLLVVMPTTNNVKAETKSIVFFEKEDIEKFIAVCETKYKTGSYKYKYGYALAANIYLGMRMGELLALQWQDINFNNNTIYISKTLIEEANPEYDKSNESLMKLNNISKVRFVIQESTKKNKNRYIPINSKAKDLLLKYKSIAQFTDPTDFVISTSNRKTNTIKNMSDTIKAMEVEAETSVQSSNTHLLRHTCASLYFRAGVPVETICQILGNTREVCEKTYIHFIEEQLQNAANQLVSQINHVEI